MIGKRYSFYFLVIVKDVHDEWENDERWTKQCCVCATLHILHEILQICIAALPTPAALTLKTHFFLLDFTTTLNYVLKWAIKGEHVYVSFLSFANAFTFFSWQILSALNRARLLILDSLVSLNDQILKNISGFLFFWLTLDHNFINSNTLFVCK